MKQLLSGPLLWLGLCFVLGIALIPATVVAANPAGDLRIEIIAAYNLVVDSNVESPSTYAPEAATLGAKICNDGSNDLTDAFAYIGNFNATTPGSSTPGVYPSVTNPPTGQVGTFALSHEGGSVGMNDATRYIGAIPAGECVTQYWLISYPRLDDNGDSVTRGVDAADDLVLTYDIWASATDGGTPLLADDTRTVAMRDEISAAANKIWPNGDNKVPDAYKNAIAAVAGWDTVTPSGTSAAYPGELVRTQGIWYDFGVANQGFDNNGDLIPDQNAWAQPVGDPDAYDPGCFRLVRTYGLIVVKLKSGGEYLIAFEDQLYFENLPANTGVVGLVYYEYIALNGACIAGLTPYQEVASGSDNEKFNGDYGHYVPPLASQEPDVTMSKSVNQSTIGPTLPATLLYTIAITNGNAITAGNSAYGLPLVIHEAIPAGTTYVAGTADDQVVINGGAITAKILYSTDGGTLWTLTEPASGVTNIQWWLQGDLPVNATGSVTFQITVPAGYSAPYVQNTGGVSYGNGPIALEDDAITFLLGNNSLGDAIFQDNGAGGYFANGSKDTGESAIANVTVTLYYDLDGDGELDATDLLWGATTSNGSGIYGFGSLPDGDYLVVIDQDDSDLPSGWAITTDSVIAVDLDSTRASSSAVSTLTADFGFAPTLTLNKELNGSSPIYEGDQVTYTIDLTNKLPGSGTPSGGACTYTIWAASEDNDTSTLPNSQHFVNSTNAFGVAGPDGVYANSAYSNALDRIAGTSFTLGTPTGAIVSVQALFSLYVSGPLTNDAAKGFLFFNNSQIATTSFTVAQLNGFAGGQAMQGFLAWNVTSARAWNWSDFAGTLDLELNSVRTSGPDGPTLYLDAIGFLVTSDQTCVSAASNIIATLPLTDTYDATRLQFVSSEPAPDTTTPAGTLTWNNVGPLYPGQTKTISVTFLALAPSGSSQSINNVAAASNPYFGDGRLANSATATATVTLNATGSIAGVLWNDVDNDGWQGTIGYEAGDGKIANVTVTLYACKATADGTLITGAASNRACSFYSGAWQSVGTQTTSSTGAYSFTGLRNGYYRVVVDQSTIPGADTQTGDPNDTVTLCSPSNCDNQSNATGDNLGATTFLGQITAANDVTNINFGYSVPAALYGNVWHDNDGDGTQDAGENGLSGVTINLYDSTCSGTVLKTTTTDSNGNYSVGDLTNSTVYCIRVITSTLTAGGTWSETAETDSSVNNQISVTAATGTISGSHNFGFHHTAASIIGDTLYYDWDGDGTQDSNEEGIPNITVYLYEDSDSDGVIDSATDALVASQSTSSSGAYLFANLPSGNYIVIVDDNDAQFPDNVSPSADPDESGACVTCDNQSKAIVNGTTSVLTKDFGYTPAGDGSIGDTVWYDKDGDGAQSGAQEMGLAAITVNLWVDLNNDGVYVLVMTTTTDADGNYLFEDLPDGDYEVRVDSSDSDLPNDAFGNGYVPSTATTVAVTVSNGSSTLTADFGFTALGAIGDVVFWDANGDAEFDWNESGITGVKVTLTNATVITTSDGTVWLAGTYVLTTTTVEGNYLFDSLPPGDYTITIDTTGPINGALQTGDADRDGVACTDNTYPTMPACDNAATVTLTYATNFMGADFGYQSPGAFGDYVWFDQDGDGMQDSGEVGIASLTVTATTTANVTVNGVNYPTGTTLTTQTDYDGYYSFSNLISNGSNATWAVTVQTPTNMAATYDPDGVNNGSTTVTINTSGAVVAVGGTSCSNCSLTVDFGFELDGPYRLSGSVCLEANGSSNGLCGNGTDTVVVSYTVYLYNDDGDYLGATTTNASGHYTFSNLIDDTYSVAIGTTLPPFDDAALTTTAADTPATLITETSLSVYQTVPLNGASQSGVDFAFLSTIDYDYGDLPQSYNTTLEGSPSGPRHVVSVGQTLYLGSTTPDSESNGSPSSSASGDGADEDGVTPVNISSWVDGDDGGAVTVTTVGSGWLVAWMDFNDDGDLLDSGELIINQALAAGSTTISFDIPSGTMAGTTAFYSRFRLFRTAPVLPQFAYVGATSGGEVEDYYLRTTSPTADLTIVKYDNLDPMSAGATLSYTIVITNNGPDDAENVVITDTLPVSTTFVTASAGCTTPGNQVVCTLGTITAGDSATLTIVVLVDPRLTDQGEEKLRQPLAIVQALLRDARHRRPPTIRQWATQQQEVTHHESA